MKILQSKIRPNFLISAPHRVNNSVSQMNRAGTVKLIFRDDMNTLYNYGMLPILQNDRYAVTFMWMREGTASLVAVI
jgi:hypothetical protein